MNRAPSVAAAVALALSGVACTKAQSTAPGVRFRQPTSVAVFRGKTLGDPGSVKPYLAVANQARNDLSILDGVTDVPVAAPIKLRTLVLGVENRPTLVAAASLGDDDPKDPSTAKPDLLVAVSAGDSVLQLVETWDTANLVHADPPLAVDLGYDVLALAVVPSAPGTARIAAALADHRVAIVTYARVADADASVAPVLPAAISDPLPFQPAAIAAMPGDPAQTSLFAATLDPIATDGSGNPVYGVEELSVPGLAPVRALGARGPTRLVAAARLQERIAGADGSGNPLPGSAANDDTAFAGQPVVPRVYAVLDESGCGPRDAIDCGVVTLDPTVPSGTEALPHDDPFMPYRAPMRVPGRPLALSVSGPPAIPPPAVAGEPDFTAPALSGYMRLYSASVARATTAVGAVASDDAYVYFLDLGRFETATTSVAVASKQVTASMPQYARPPTCTTLDTKKPECAGRRLWLEDASGAFISSALGVGDVVAMTPGWTPDEQWSLVYQGLLTNDLFSRVGEAGEAAPGVPWLAFQVPAGGDSFSDVVRLWDPAFGVAPGDILVAKASRVGCEGTPSGVTTDTDNQFEVEVDGLLPPDVAHPGGAVTLRHRTTDEDPKWAACYDALVAATAGGNTLTGLVATIRAGGYVLTGASSGLTGILRVDAGYVVGEVGTDPPSTGRPQPGVPFTLAYQDEDALASTCPFEQWDWTLPIPPAVLACDAACRSACEQLATARKLRRNQGISVDCATNSTLTNGCSTTWPGNAFPLVPSPVALAFTFGLQKNPADPVDETDPTVGSTPFRDLRLTIVSKSNATLLLAAGTSTSPFQASAITTFDRSPWTDPLAGYRFLVAYPADFVLDTTPGQSGAPSTVIR